MDNLTKRVSFQFGSFFIEGVLNDSPTAEAIWEKLPIESIVNLWGKEIYFETPVLASLDENAVSDVKKGDICYWPMGRAICIFFGPTPLSKGQEVVPASPVNFVGEIIGDIELLNNIEEREIVKINRIMNKGA
jgi:hypothetical protein